MGRGYNTSLHYWEHMNDYWTMRAVQTACFNATDLWDTDRPAVELRGSGYEELVFEERLLAVVREHDVASPLLLFYAPHVAHMPLEHLDVSHNSQTLRGAPQHAPQQGCSGGSERYLRGGGAAAPAGGGVGAAGQSSATTK